MKTTRSVQPPHGDDLPDRHVVIRHIDRADSHLLFLSVSDLWVIVMRRFHDNNVMLRLQKITAVSGSDDELADLEPF
jgi:hypothetical protein